MLMPPICLLSPPGAELLELTTGASSVRDNSTLAEKLSKIISTTFDEQSLSHLGSMPKRKVHVSSFEKLDFCHCILERLHGKESTILTESVLKTLEPIANSRFADHIFLEAIALVNDPDLLSSHTSLFLKYCHQLPLSICTTFFSQEL